MDVIWEGRLAGEFHGYLCGNVYVLPDGTRWRQESRTKEPVYRENPTARLLWEQSLGRHYLDVEGTSATVWVVEEKYSRSWGCGAF